MSQKKGIVNTIAVFIQVCILSIIAALSFGASARATGSIAITGTVTGQNGVGLANISVTADAPGTNNVDYGPAATATDGSYTLYVNAGSYDFHFTAPTGSGMNSTVDSNVAVTGNHTINVQLVPSSNTFSGTLTDQNGNPIAGDAIYLTNTQDNGSAHGTTDSNGNFSFSANADTYTTVEVDYNGAASQYTVRATSPIDLTSGNVSQNLQVNLVALTVVVKDANGNPLAGVKVQGTSTMSATSPLIVGSTMQAQANLNFQAQTDANGSYTTLAPVGVSFGPGIGNGSAIRATTPTQVIGLSTPLTVNGATSVTLSPTPRYLLSGTLTDQNGNPIAGGIVTVWNNQDGNSAHGTTDSNGHFSFQANADTYVNVAVTGSTSTSSYSVTSTSPSLDLTSGNVSQNLQVNLVALTVVVKDANGNPLAGVGIQGTSLGGAGSITTPLLVGSTAQSRGNVSFQAQTDTNGVYTTMVPLGAIFQPGTGNGYTLRATTPTQVIGLSTPLTVNGATSVTLSPTPRYTFSGTLTDQDGSPIAGDSIYLINTQNNGSAHGTTDSNGHFSLLANADTYNTVEVDCSNSISQYGVRSSSQIGLTSSNVTQNLQLNLVALTVVAKDSNGNPLANATIKGDSENGITSPLLVGSTSQPQLNVSFQVQTDSSGSYTIMVPVGTAFQTGSGNYNTLLAITSIQRIGLSSPLTVSQPTTVILQQAPPAPSAPTNLTISSLTPSPSLAWTASSGATSYNIYRNGSLIDSITTSNTTSYTDYLAPQGTDTYYVTAVNDGGESGPSNTVQVLTAPTGLNAMTPTNNAPILTWNAVPTATSYQVWRQDTNTGINTQVDTSTTANFTDTYLPGVYNYSVVAVNGTGLASVPSAQFQVAVTNTTVSNSNKMTAQGHTEVIPVFGTDVLPGLAANNSTIATFDFSLGYPGGTFTVSRPLTLTFNSGGRTLFITSTSIDWLVVSGSGNSLGTLQGIVSATLDNVTTAGLPFTVTAQDGTRTTPTSADNFKLTVYTNSSRNTVLYSVDEQLSKGKAKIN